MARCHRVQAGLAGQAGFLVGLVGNAIAAELEHLSPESQARDQVAPTFPPDGRGLFVGRFNEKQGRLS